MSELIRTASEAYNRCVQTPSLTQRTVEYSPGNDFKSTTMSEKVIRLAELTHSRITAGRNTEIRTESVRNKLGKELVKKKKKKGRDKTEKIK